MKSFAEAFFVMLGAFVLIYAAIHGELPRLFPHTQESQP